MSYKPISTKALKTSPVKKRKSKVGVDDFAGVLKRGSSVKDFLGALPNVLAARDLREVAAAIAAAHSRARPVMIAMGAHVIKTGLSPLIIDLIERGVISAVAMAGAGIVHDFELAYAGATSEDVDAEIGRGSFGMAEETGRLLNEAITKGAASDVGMGQAIGEMIESSDYPYKDKSIFAAAVRSGIPATVHVAIGTDIIHVHPKMDAQATGKTSYRDFLLFADVVSNLEHGVFINMGSAVVLPEVFLKALTLVRNLGHEVKNITTVNMDFIRQYRPLTNVVRRPTLEGGKGYSLTGHHEIMVPLLYAALIETLEEAQ